MLQKMFGLSGNTIGKGNRSDLCYIRLFFPLGRSRESFILIWMFNHEQKVMLERHVVETTPEAIKTKPRKQLEEKETKSPKEVKPSSLLRANRKLANLFKRSGSRLWTHLLCVPLCDFIEYAQQSETYFNLQIVWDWACWKITMHNDYL